MLCIKEKEHMLTFTNSNWMVLGLTDNLEFHAVSLHSV